MTAAILERANDELRAAVKARLEATDPSDDKLKGYKPGPLAGCEPAQQCAADLLSRESCCEGQPQHTTLGYDAKTMRDARDFIAARDEFESFRGDSLLKSDVHPTSQAFFDLCDQLKTMHSKKSSDYGSADDPLANIRNGAEFVGIEPWRAAMVRLSDKVTRLATYCRTGSLTFEGVEDTLFDLASYSLLTLLTHREEHRGS
jgi:hypothetical protein